MPTSVPGTALRRAAMLASTSAGAKLSRPSLPRTWRWISCAPARTTAAASVASSAGVVGSPGWLPRCRPPFRQAWTITGGSRRLLPFDRAAHGRDLLHGPVAGRRPQLHRLVELAPGSGRAGLALRLVEPAAILQLQRRVVAEEVGRADGVV